MATTFVKIKCPHCHKVLEKYSFHGMNEGKYWGNPEKKCPHCLKTYFDDRFREIATKPISWFEKRKPYGTAGAVMYWTRYILCFPAVFSRNKEIGAFFILCAILDHIVLLFYCFTHTQFVVDEEFRQKYYESAIRLEIRKQAEQAQIKKQREYESYRGLDYRELIAKAKAAEREK